MQEIQVSVAQPTTDKVAYLEVVRDAGFATRMESACDAHDHCPSLHQGRLTWIAEQFRTRFDAPISVETVRKWHKGVAKPRRDRNDQLAELLQVDPVWLYMGVDPEMTPRERKIRNTKASGVVNLVAGLIQLDGGHPAFPDDADKTAQRDHVDLYAIIRGANYRFHVTLGEADAGRWRFVVPTNYQDIVVLGVIRNGFTARIVELRQEMIEAGTRRGGSIEVIVPDDVAGKIEITTFSSRI